MHSFLLCLAVCFITTPNNIHAFHIPRLPVVRSFLQRDSWGVSTDEDIATSSASSSSTALGSPIRKSPSRNTIINHEVSRTAFQSIWQNMQFPPERILPERTATRKNRPKSRKQKEINQRQNKRKEDKKEEKRRTKPKPPPVETGNVCRVVTLSDGMIPLDAVPSRLRQEPYILRKLDDIYHSLSHEETRRLRYMDRPDDEGIAYHNDSEEKRLVTVVRNSLEDAGFELLSRRDMDLCDSLNAGYLLRLSIVPDVQDLDPGLAQEFYPEWFDEHGNVKMDRELLFDGKVLVYWRGYDTETTKGRLLLAKLDYLQTSLVQSAAVSLKTRLDAVERLFSRVLRRTKRGFLAWSVSKSRAVVDQLPREGTLRLAVRRKLRHWRPSKSVHAVSRAGFFQLARYGGSRKRFLGANALEPFLIYESDAEEYCHISFDDDESTVTANGSTSAKKRGGVSRVNGVTAKSPPNQNEALRSSSTMTNNNATDASSVDEEFYDCINHSELRCPYDQDVPSLPPMQLLRRVSMNNVVDLFSRDGRRNLFSSLFAKTELVEPTYKEVVVIWRPKEPEPPRPRFQPPDFVYEVADLFDIEGIEPPKPPPPPKPLPLEIRTFDGTPLANLPAVFPKTKLVFRPADAFVFDLISIVSLGLAVSSARFDNTKLDILALVSVTLWLIRVAIRYSNKLARYDLLVKTFLTSKISHRNAGALKYLAAEAGGQRATRAALVHDWLCQQSSSQPLLVGDIIRDGPSQINALVENKQVDLDMQAALNDLEDLKLLQIIEGDRVLVTCAPGAVERRLRQAWNDIFQGGLSLNFLTGRR